MKLAELLLKRRSTRFFDPLRKLDDGLIEKILADVAQTPSWFNLHPWRFIVVQSSDGKQALYKAARRQDKVLEASACIVLCGDESCWKLADEISAKMAENGYFPPEARSGMVNLIHSLYRNPQTSRQYISRDVMLASMVLMLSATESGIDSAPMADFDAHKVCNVLKLPDHVFPVLMIALGYSRKANPQRTERTPIAELAHAETWGASLFDSTDKNR